MGTCPCAPLCHQASGTWTSPQGKSRGCRKGKRKIKRLRVTFCQTPSPKTPLSPTIPARQTLGHPSPTTPLVGTLEEGKKKQGEKCRVPKKKQDQGRWDQPKHGDPIGRTRAPQPPAPRDLGAPCTRDWDGTGSTTATHTLGGTGTGHRHHGGTELSLTP